MARPDFAFRTSTHTVRAAAGEGLFCAEPGGHQLRLTLEEQTLPRPLLSPQMERAVAAWVIARGGRQMNLNGERRQIDPRSLDRPAPGAVKRLVSIAPSNTEIVGSLGAVTLLAGVDNGSDFPPQINSLPRLGPELFVDMEALGRLKPDLVLASLTVPGMERNITALEALAIPTLVIAPLGLAEIGEGISRVGGALGRERQAAEVVAALELRSRAFRARRSAGAPTRVYLEWWPKPMFSPGGPCWSNELIELAGGVNVFAHLAGQSAEVSIEQVARADPEVVFISWCGVPARKLDPARVKERPGLGGVSAVRNARVFAVDESLLGRPGPRVLDGVARMAEHIQST